MIQHIYDAVTHVTGCTKIDLRGRSKRTEIARRRNMLCALLSIAGMNTSAIAFELSRSRTTVRQALRMHADELSYDGRYAEEYKEILSHINLNTKATKSKQFICK